MNLYLEIRRGTRLNKDFAGISIKEIDLEDGKKG